MKRRGYLALVFLVVVSALLAAGGCSLGGGGGQGVSSTSTSVFGAATSTQPATNTTTTLTPADELSTFKAKDPFIQQAQTTIAASSTSQSTTTSSTGSSSSSTSTTVATSGGASVHIHSLKVLSVDAGPTVTFRVDSAVYDAKKVGDVVSTTWGQIKVLSIDTAGQYVKLLHGSETLKLDVGQTTFE